MRMTPNTPRIPFLLHKRRARIERIATLGAKEMSDMPLGAARHHHLALDGRLATLAPRAEHLVEVEVAVEAQRLVVAVVCLELRHGLGRGMRVEEGEVLAAGAGADPGYARGVLGGGFWVEGHAFEVLAAVVAEEAFGVETGAAGGDDAAGDGERALGAEGAGAHRRGREVIAGGRGGGCRGGAVSRKGAGGVVLGVRKGARGACGGAIYVDRRDRGSD